MMMGTILWLQEELEHLRNNQRNTAPDAAQSSDVQRYKDLYENELKLRERLAARLEKANEKSAQAALL